MSEVVPPVPNKLKVVVVGNGEVGKTCLVSTYGNNGFPDKYVMTVAKNFESKIKYQNKEITLDIWDTGGQDEFKSVRPISYNETDVFIVCFAANNRESFSAATSKWVEEIEDTGPKNAGKILCCTKSDLRQDNESCVSH